MNSKDGFRELGRHECLRLLATAPIGRIVTTRHALPAVVPVNFGLDADGSVLLRTSVASEPARAIDGVVVAFEADTADPDTHSGWSVVMTGRAEIVTDPSEVTRLERVAPRSRALSPDEVLVRIAPELVTGRALVDGRTMYGLPLST
ncbi:pyridoxamine 5'-phosphate oxidase family protein [Streptomyces sp. NPDC051452]|uniref:pyridoxamine 5'-phosphate oxidase family protein n=1 Tax=Streptomyces sp. NPDC051452 TaxID=3365654 RepID=UPI0037A7D6CE